MAPAARPRLTRYDGMKFAFTLGAAFAAISVVLALRHRDVAAEVAFGVGALLLLLGMVVPTRLGPLERAWMGLGHAIGRVTTPIALGLIYYVALTPIGYLRRSFARSPLARDRSAETFWIPRVPRDAGERHRALERQF